MTFSIFVLIALIELVRLEASAAGVNLKPSSLVDTDGSSFAKSSSDDVSPGTEIPSALAGRISYANQVEYSFALSDVSLVDFIISSCIIWIVDLVKAK